MKVLFLRKAPTDREHRPLAELRAGIARHTDLRPGDYQIDTFIPYALPKDRAPNATEFGEAIPRLLDILETGAPDIVVGVGATATKALLGPVNMAYVHGIPHAEEVAGHAFTVFPMYDPAAALGNKGFQAAIHYDLDRLGAFLRGDLPVWEAGPPVVSKWLEGPLGGDRSHSDNGRQSIHHTDKRALPEAGDSSRAGRVLGVDRQHRSVGLRDAGDNAAPQERAQDDPGASGCVGSVQRANSRRSVRASSLRQPDLHESGAPVPGHEARQQPRPGPQAARSQQMGVDEVSDSSGDQTGETHRVSQVERPICSIDTEGWADRPWGLQFSVDGVTGWCIKATDRNLLRWFNGWVKQFRVFMHNGIGDLPVLRAMGIELDAFEDTQLLLFHHMLNTGSGVLDAEAQNLGAAGYRFCGMTFKELKDVPGVDLDARVLPYSNDMLAYAGVDAAAEFRLASALWQWIVPLDAVMGVYRIDQSQAFLIRAMMDAGLPFDYDATADYYMEASDRERSVRAELEEMAARRGTRSFNPASSKQVREIVVEKYGLRIRKRTKGGAISTNEKALSQHAAHPFVAKMQEHRELKKLLGTYLTPLMEELAEE